MDNHILEGTYPNVIPNIRSPNIVAFSQIIWATIMITKLSATGWR
jgi:hypothetical protein